MRAVVPDVPFDESIPIKFWKVTAPLAMRSVVEAVTAVTIVVEAYGAVRRATVGRVREPLVEKVEVAVAPKYAVPVLEKRVEDALRNDWRAVQTLALAILSESEEAVPPICEPSVPELERDAPMAREEVAVEYTTPELPARRPERDVARVVAPVTFNVPPTAVLPEESIVVEAV